MALVVTTSPAGGKFTEFLRIDIVAVDDGNLPEISGPFDILFTTDGSIPSTTNPSTSHRRSPIKNFPISKPTTIKYFAQTTDAVTQTSIQTEFYDVIELTARNTIPTVQSGIRNYTLTIADGDIVRDERGLFTVVSGADKTAQDIQEIILVEDVPEGTPIGTRTLPEFGSALNRILGLSFPQGFAANVVETSLFSAMETLISLQRLERVPSDEQIRRILQVRVAPKNETDYKYKIVVETVGRRVVTSSGVIVVT